MKNRVDAQSSIAASRKISLMYWKAPWFSVGNVIVSGVLFYAIKVFVGAVMQHRGPEITDLFVGVFFGVAMGFLPLRRLSNELDRWLRVQFGSKKQ